MEIVNLDNRKKESYKIFDDIAPTYDFLNHLLSGGIDIYWRHRLSKKLPDDRFPLMVLDLACGTGDVGIKLIKNPKVGKVIGVDMSEKMIAKGQEKIAKLNLQKKVILEKGDAMNIPMADRSVDVVTISFGIRNFSNPNKALQEIYRVLRPDGKLIIMEFSIPSNFIVKKLYFFYFRHILPLIGNIVSKHADAYTYLNKTVEDFPYGKNFLHLMADQQFVKLEMETLTAGLATIYVGKKLK